MNAEVIRAFDRARAYDAAARVQAHAARRLADRIADLPLRDDADILEIGCGTGLLSTAMIGRIPARQWLLTDIAPAMLTRCADRIGQRPNVTYAVLDGERAEIDGAFDLICSSFVFQWFDDLPRAAQGLRGLLRPGGRLSFATMAAGSLAEWNTAHRAATGHDAAMGGYPTPEELQALGAMVDIEHYTESHANARAFLASLRAIGAHRPRRTRPPVSALALRRAMAEFEAAGASVTYVIAYGTVAA